MARTIKTCRCCGTRAQTRKQRVCKACKVPALWDCRTETASEAEERARADAAAEAVLRDLLSGNATA